jgi:homoserine kinase type II
VPGQADYLRSPSTEKLTAALVALAEFHQAAASFRPAGNHRSRSPSILKRENQLRRLMDGGIDQLAAAIRPDVFPPMEARARQFVRRFPQVAGRVRQRLRRAARLQISLQPCIRDIWSDHVLFLGRRVTGFIDFGAMQQENVAADVSRLLGSMAGSDAQAWREGLAAYQSVRTLSEAEQTLIPAFDHSGVLMAGLNWIDWIYRQQRAFDNWHAIVERLDRLLTRLNGIAESRESP